MASLLRQIVAGPRVRHPETGLDLCYVTDRIIATSGPSSTYPKRAYRNPLDGLVKFLDQRHGKNWAIWEFRAEGTGYPDSEVYGRIWHYPFPDHHPPPFALIPNIMASMRNWLKESEERVVVVHCKAGKGRSGTAACSYLVSEEGWALQDALNRFTERRMKPSFGAGISIPSQMRWLRYVEQWTKQGKSYVEQKIQIIEVHVWGLRAGVKVGVEGFVDGGRTIKLFHLFDQKEREIIRGSMPPEGGFADVVGEVMARTKNSSSSKPSSRNASGTATPLDSPSDSDVPFSAEEKDSRHTCDAIFRSNENIIIPTNDVNIAIERRNKAGYSFTMPTSVAHVWFNAYFESTKDADGDPMSKHSGLFEIEWAALDGIKGSEEKGTKAFERLAVAWTVATDDEGERIQKLILEPAEGQAVEQMEPADWRHVESSTPVLEASDQQQQQQQQCLDDVT